MRMFTATLTALLLAGCAFAQDWNVSVKTDTNGALRVPLAAPFRATNDIASASAMNASNTADRAYALGLVTNASIASSNYTDTIAGGKASTNEMSAVVATNAAQDISIASSLTNGVGSGCTVTTTGKTFYVSVVAPTGTAASVDADLQDHKTNNTAHAELFSNKLSPTEGTNIALAVTASMMLTGNVATATSAGSVTGGQSNTIETAVQPAALSGYMPTGSAHSTLSGILGSGSLHVSAADTNLIAKALQPVITTGTPIGDYGISGFSIDLSANGNADIFPAFSVVGKTGSAIWSNSFAAVDGLFYRMRGTAQPAEYLYRIYDEGNFLAGTHYLSPFGSGSNLTGITAAQVVADPAGTAAAATNGIDAAFIAAKGGLTNITAAQIVGAGGLTNVTPVAVVAAGAITNRVFVTPTALACSPTTTITRAIIDAAPWGEMSLSLTQACYLTFDATVTNTADAATFGLYITGTNSLTWNTNLLTGTAWTNATATGSDRIFRKASGKSTVAIW
jgi:hypothetical protein